MIAEQPYGEILVTDCGLTAHSHHHGDGSMRWDVSVSAKLSASNRNWCTPFATEDEANRFARMILDLVPGANTISYTRRTDHGFWRSA